MWTNISKLLEVIPTMKHHVQITILTPKLEVILRNWSEFYLHFTKLYILLEWEAWQWGRTESELDLKHTKLHYLVMVLA